MIRPIKILIFVLAVVLILDNGCGGFSTNLGSLATLADRADAPSSTEQATPDFESKQIGQIQRFAFSDADIDFNGTTDALTYDRTKDDLSVRLFGELQNGHPYIRDELNDCKKQDYTAGGNVDYCSEWARPEESVAQVGLGENNTSQVTLINLKQKKSADFSTTQPSPLLLVSDKEIFAFKVFLENENRSAQRKKALPLRMKLSSLKIPIKFAYQNDQVTQFVGIYQLKSGSIVLILKTRLANNLSYIVFDPKTPQDTSELKAVPFAHQKNIADSECFPGGEVLAQQSQESLGFRVVCGTSNSNSLVLSVFEAHWDQTKKNAFAKILEATGDWKIDSSAIFAPEELRQEGLIAFIRSSDGVSIRYKYATTISDSIEMREWYCPWTPSGYAERSPSEDSELAVCSRPNWRSHLPNYVQIISQNDCPTEAGRKDCAPAIQQALDTHSIVLLEPGVYNFGRELRLNSLDPKSGATNDQNSKKLIAMIDNLVVFKPYNRFYNDTGLEIDNPIKDDSFFNCRGKLTNESKAEYSEKKRQLVVTDYCNLILIEGRHITLSGVNIDASDLPILTNQGELLSYNSITVGRTLSSNLQLDANSNGKPIPQNLRHTTAAPVWENIKVKSVQITALKNRISGFYSASYPSLARNVLLEDFQCYAGKSSLSSCYAPNGFGDYNQLSDYSAARFVPASPYALDNFQLIGSGMLGKKCILSGGEETYRLSSVTRAVVKNCEIIRSNGWAVLLYVGDSGGKLDVYFKDVTLVSDSSHLSSKYKPGKNYSLVPKRYDASGAEIKLDQGWTSENSPNVVIAGKGYTRNWWINDKSLATVRWKKIGQLFLFKETPSQVLFESFKSKVIDGNSDSVSISSEHLRNHIQEIHALSGSFICSNCEFSGGNLAYRGTEQDLLDNRFVCTHWDARGVCDGFETGLTLVDGQHDPMPLGEKYILEPNAEFGRAHTEKIIFEKSIFNLSSKNSDEKLAVIIIDNQGKRKFSLPK